MPLASNQAAARVCRLKPSYFLGIATEVSGNVHFIDENTLLYPIGRVLLFHDLLTDNQRYMKVPDTPKIISRLVVSPNRKFVAVIEKEGKPTISIFNLETRYRVIILGNPLSHNSAATFEHVSFTCDSEYIVAVMSDCDPTMICYKINGQVESYAPAKGELSLPGVNITQIACNPSDRTIICLVGFGLFRFISWTGGQWIQYGFNSAKKLEITCVCWITNEMVLAGTRCGRLIAIEYGDVRGVYSASTFEEMHIVKGGAGEHKIDMQDRTIPKGYKNGIFQVNGLASYPGGFAFSYARTMVVVVERTDLNTWKKRNVVFTIEPSKLMSHKKAEDDIRFISISPSGNKLSCTTGRREVYFVDITERNAGERGLKLCSKVLSGFHSGKIAGIATCRWKPLLMTVGKHDGTCRLWNFKTKKLILCQGFPDDKIHGCAFHPSGWYCLVGFKHQLKMFLVMVDELKSLRLFRIKMCSLMSFSKQGHLFAAGNTARRTIEVYCSVSFENIWVFKCYNNPVTALHFGCNDCYLYTTDPDGSVNFWDLQLGEDINNKIFLDTPNNDVATTRRGTVIFVGGDGTLNEIKNDHLRSYKLDQKTLHAIAIGEAEECLFVGGEKRSIMSIEFPVNEPLLSLEAKMHSWPIMKLLITDNDSTLISLDAAGIVGIWRIKIPWDKRPPKFVNIPELCEVVVNTRKLAEEDETIVKQQLNIDRKLYQHNYILQHLEDVKDKELDKLTKRFIREIGGLKKSIKTNEKDHSSNASELQQTFDRMQKYYVGELEKQSKEFESDLMEEYLKGDCTRGHIVVFVWDVRKFVRTAKAATRQIFDLYDTFVNSKIADIKAETVELRFKRKCLLQKFDRETYNFEKFLNDLMEEYKCYHNRRLTKLRIRIEYLKDEILFLIKKSSSLDEKIRKFYGSGMRVFRHLDEMRQDSRMLKTKIKALRITLEALAAQARKKENLTISLRKAIKSDQQQQMEKSERMEALKFSIRPMLEAEVKDLRHKQESLVEALDQQRAEMAKVTLCIAAVEKMNRELQEKKDQIVVNDVHTKKYVEEVKHDLTVANKMSDNRAELEKSLMELYNKYINPFASIETIADNCDDGGLPVLLIEKQSAVRGLSASDKTGLEDVVEFYEMEQMLKKAEESLRGEISVMKKTLPRPRLLVGSKCRTFSPQRMTKMMKQINKYRYRLGEALEFLAADAREDGCPCEHVPSF